MGRLFEVNAIKCASCGGEMKVVAAISDDVELERLMRHLGIEADFPKTKPARSPPVGWGGEDSQVDPEVDAWEGRDEERAED